MRILTRNSRRDSVVKWLQMQGASVPPILTALKHQSKVCSSTRAALHPSYQTHRVHLLRLQSYSPQVSILRDSTHWADQGGSACHCILFVDDSIAEHLDDGFEGLNCVRVLFTRGVKGGRGDDDA